MNINPKNLIRRKVAKRVVITLIITTVALSVVNLIYMSRRIVNEQKIELELATELCSDQIESWTSRLEGISGGIADTVAALGTLDETTIKAILNQSATSNTDLFYIYVGTEEGEMYMARGVTQDEGYDPRKRDWYKLAKAAGHPVVVDPYLSASSPDTMLITVASPIYFGTKMVGVVGADVDIDTMVKFVKSVNFENGAYGFIVDKNGNIVTHPNEDFLPAVDKITNISDTETGLSNVIEKSKVGVVEGTDYTGTKMYYYSKVLSDSKWTVAVAYPKNNVLKLIDRAIRISLAIVIFAIIIGAAYTTIIITEILRPIEKINPSIDRLMEGDFATRIDISTKEDELGVLQNKMSALIDEMTEIIQSQKYVLGEMEKGNLIVDDMPEFPGDFSDITKSVNSIKERFNDIITDIQFSAINLQSFAMGINESSNLEEMRTVFEELSAEANNLMDKTSQFKTMPTIKEDSQDE